MPTENKKMQQRRDTAANWTSNNPTLSAGEIGVETDTGKFKVGDGATAWNSIADYFMKIPAAVSSTELGYLDGVTSAIQTQINAKAPIASPTFTGTVSGITASMVGLGNVDNTSDATKNAAAVTLMNKTVALGSNTVSGTIAQFNTALTDGDFATLAGAETLTNKTLTSPVVNSPTGIVKGDVGLGNVDNTSDANKPVSTAQQTAIDAAKIQSIGIACSDETTNLVTGTAKVTFRMPYAFTLTAVRASVNTAPTGSTLIVDINEGGVSILSTKLSIDASEKTSTTAASAAVISDSALADDAEITIDIDQVGSTIPGKGLKVWLIGTKA